MLSSANALTDGTGATVKGALFELAGTAMMLAVEESVRSRLPAASTATAVGAATAEVAVVRV